LVNFTFSHGKIVITPKLVIDRSQFPNADEEYTPAQRRVIDARLAKSEKSPFDGPFDTDEELLASLHVEAKKLHAKTTNRRSK
jgi:hypothetical protein